MTLVHGEFDVSVEGNIIHIVMAGSFNEYTIEAISKLIEQAIVGLENRPFYMLIDIRHVDGGTPEAYEASAEFNLWLDQQNLVAKALITKSVLFQQINESRVREHSSQRVAYFDNVDAAKRWFESFE
ncbi:hypothetical protein GCM10011369_30780 [Neiella marina]|uniref:Uncharacterized protein n=1 Tax=Neiella marina TaxID=508461 RepID=A0A8J2U8R9_9GAMM|nr:STAS/SEC14 domain-containing protein [Neiella marina]GGA86558.1 hypothetical protein GCM10011369_30780 [Neiella marina]